MHTHMHIIPEEPFPLVPDEVLSGVGRVLGVGLDVLLPWVADGGGRVLGLAVVRSTRSSFFPLDKSTVTI